MISQLLHAVWLLFVAVGVMYVIRTIGGSKPQLLRPWWHGPSDLVHASSESLTVKNLLVMSLRDHYAAHAPEPNVSELREVFPPQGRMSMHDEGYTRWRMEARAVWAFHYADLMVRAREKGGVR